LRRRGGDGGEVEGQREGVIKTWDKRRGMEGVKRRGRKEGIVGIL